MKEEMAPYGINLLLHQGSPTASSFLVQKRLSALYSIFSKSFDSIWNGESMLVLDMRVSLVILINLWL